MQLSEDAPKTAPQVCRTAGFFGCMTPKSDVGTMAAGRHAFTRTFGWAPSLELEIPCFAIHLGLGSEVT